MTVSGWIQFIVRNFECCSNVKICVSYFMGIQWKQPTTSVWTWKGRRSWSSIHFPQVQVVWTKLTHLDQFTHPNSLWSLLRLKVTLSCCGWQIPGSRKLLKSRISRTGEGENSWGIQWHILLLHHSPPWRKCMSAQDMLPRKDGPPDQVVTLTPMMARNERRNK